MRIAVWSYCAAVGLACLTVAMLGSGFKYYFHWSLNGKPLPAMTDLATEDAVWALVLALPWVGAAIWLSRREAATPSRVFAYAGLSTFAIVFLFAFVAIAFSLPLVVRTGPLGP